MEKVYTEEKVLSGERDTEYYINGERFPYLVIYDSGCMVWKKDGKQYRVDRPALCMDNDKLWRLNNKHHRTDGPAELYASGSKFWRMDDEYHRTDGPTCINCYGTQSWYINNKKTTQENIEKLQEKYFYKWKRKMNF